MRTNSMDAQYNYPLPAEYPALLDLFKDWRDFENPTLLNGAPDYTADRFNKEHQAFKDLEKRLTQIEIDDWPIPYQVDWHIVRAEMNGYDFNYRVLQPWVRDPAFYQTVWMFQSDVPAHEGPTNHATLELWTYQFPLTHEEEKRLTDDLEVIPTFLEQARGNLTGNARDLWVAGIENFKQQARDLDQITERFEGSKVKSGLLGALDNAQDATKYFIAWLEEQATGKT